MRKLLILIVMAIVLAGCNGEQNKSASTNANKQLLNDVELLLKKHDNIKDYSIVIAQPYIAVSIDVSPWQRYKKKKIADKVEKQLKEKFKNYKLIVSSDIKMKFELQKIHEKAPVEQAKKLEKLKKLLKEET